MFKILKWLVGLVVLVAVLLVVGVLMLPGERMAKIAASQLTNVLGREVQITGSVKPSFYPTLGVKADGIIIAAPDWAESQTLVRANALSASVALRPLLDRQVQVKAVSLSGVSVDLERAADGRVSWDFGGDTAPVAGGDDGTQTQVTIDTVTLRDARISYVDQATSTRTVLNDFDATVNWGAGQSLRVRADGTLNGQRLTMASNVENADAFLEGAAQSVVLDATVGRATIGFNGLVDTSGQAQGTLDADVTDIASLMRAAGQAAPSLPTGVREKLAVQGEIIVTPDRVALADATLDIGVNQFRGSLIAAISGKPNLTGRLTTGTLNAAPFLQGGGGESTSAQGWSKDRIDLSGLAAFDADISFSANAVNLGDHTLGATNVNLALDNARLVATLTEVRGFGGTLVGNLVANNRNGLSVGGDIRASDVNLRQMLGELAGFDNLATIGDARIKFLGSGNSVDSILRSLSGEGALSTTAGELFGVDFVKYFTDQSATGGSTIFDGMQGTFSINNGELSNVDLSVLAPLFSALGEGSIDLGAQTIDYLIRPEIVSGFAEGSGLPVRISGSWSNLKIRPDFEYLAQQKLAIEEEKLKAEAEAKVEAEKAKLEAKIDREKAAAKAKLKAEAEKALNVEIQDGQSVEDALKDKVEDELKKGLLNLLGGN